MLHRFLHPIGPTRHLRNQNTQAQTKKSVHMTHMVFSLVPTPLLYREPLCLRPALTNEYKGSL